MSRDLQLVAFPDSRQTVGEKQHIVGATLVLEHPECGGQGAIDVGAAAGVESIGEAECGHLCLGIHPLQFGPETLDLRVIGHDVEGVLGVESSDEVLECIAGLLDLLSVHAARSIDDKHDGLGQDLGLAGFHFGAGQQQEVAVVIGIGAVADQVHPDQRVLDAIEESEVVGSGDVLECQFAVGVVVVGSLDID